MLNNKPTIVAPVALVILMASVNDQLMKGDSSHCVADFTYMLRNISLKYCWVLFISTFSKVIDPHIMGNCVVQKIFLKIDDSCRNVPYALFGIVMLQIKPQKQVSHLQPFNEVETFHCLTIFFSVNFGLPKL